MVSNISMCARIGLVTGDGIAGIMRKKYSKKVVFPLVSLLIVANTINISADIGAMAASVSGKDISIFWSNGRGNICF